MEANPSRELEFLRGENAALRSRLSAYGGTNGHSLPKSAGIRDLIGASIVLESITEGFFGLDEQWRFAYVNDEAERLLGRKRNDLPGKNVWQEFPAAISRRNASWMI